MLQKLAGSTHPLDVAGWEEGTDRGPEGPCEHWPVAIADRQAWVIPATVLEFQQPQKPNSGPLARG